MFSKVIIGTVFFVLGVSWIAVSGQSTLETSIKLVKANLDDVQLISSDDTQTWIQTVETDLGAKLRSRVVSYASIEVVQTSPTVDIIVTTTDVSYSNVVQKELEDIMQETLDAAKSSLYGVPIVSYNVFQTGLMQFTKSVAMIEASLRLSYTGISQDTTTLDDLMVQITMYNIRPELEHHLLANVIGFVTMDFVQLAPSLEIVILVDPVVDAARTRAAVEYALQQATQDDQKLGDVAAAADTIRVRNRAGRRLPLWTHVAMAYEGDTYKSEGSNETLKDMFLPFLDHELKGLKEVEVYDTDPVIRLRVLTYTDEDKSKIQEAVKRALVRGSKDKGFVDNSILVEKSMLPAVPCVTRARFTLKESHGDLMDEYVDLNHPISQLMLKAIIPELKGFLVEIPHFTKLQVTQIIPTFEMRIYTMTSPDKVGDIKGFVEGVLMGPINSGHLAELWHPGKGSLVVETAYMELKEIETTVTFKFSDIFPEEYSDLESEVAQALIKVMKPELEYSIADYNYYMDRIEIQQIVPKVIVNVVSMAPLQTTTEEVDKLIKKGLQTLLQKVHMAGWHPDSKTLRVNEPSEDDVVDDAGADDADDDDYVYVDSYDDDAVDEPIEYDEAGGAAQQKGSSALKIESSVTCIALTFALLLFS